MKIVPIISSSKGNSVYIGTDTEGILVDLGCGLRTVKMKLATFGIPVTAIKGIIVTHEHSDHIKGITDKVLKDKNIEVYATGGTIQALNYLDPYYDSEHIYMSIKTLADDIFLGGLQIQYFNTPHDASESCGFIIKTPTSGKIGYATDVGYLSDKICKSLIGCETVYLESNYDETMLKNNPMYSSALKKRIQGQKGHLSNKETARFSAELVEKGTKCIILGHISPENNTPELAYTTVANLVAKYTGFQSGKDYQLFTAPRLHKDDNFVVVV